MAANPEELSGWMEGDAAPEEGESAGGAWGSLDQRRTINAQLAGHPPVAMETTSTGKQGRWAHLLPRTKGKFLLDC